MAIDLNLAEVGREYRAGRNIMELLRDGDERRGNSLEAIEVAYDLQAGSYVEALADPGYANRLKSYARALAEILKPLSPRSLLEAGVGEATTLGLLLSDLSLPEGCLGFDLSWSRLNQARRFLDSVSCQASLMVGNLLEIPLEDRSVDVVFTSHAIEPNRGRERSILRELYRVAARYLVLLEPSSELGNEATRENIERHQYCQDLSSVAVDLGYEIVEHRLFDVICSDRNQTALLVIRKAEIPPAGPPRFACPGCRRALLRHRGQLFCERDSRVYPILEGIPCLRREHGILAGQFLESLEI